MTIKSVVVVGSINQDLTFFTPRFAAPGETLEASDFGMHPGGKGANQAVAAARLGVPVSMVACVGNDAFGPSLRAGLEAEGIDTSHIHQVNLSTGIAAIMVRPDGENAIIIHPGANTAVTPDLVAGLKTLIADAGALLLQLEIPLTSVMAAAKIARQSQVPVILDPAPARELPPALLADVDIITPNAGEASVLTGVDVHCWKTAAMAAAKLRSQGVGTVLVTMGKFGALYSSSDGDVRITAPQVAAVDTTAAGDAFNGALAAALVRGLAIDAAADIAAAAGALAVTQAGAQPSLPKAERLDEVVKLPWLQS